MANKKKKVVMTKEMPTFKINFKIGHGCTIEIGKWIK